MSSRRPGSLGSKSPESKKKGGGAARRPPASPSAAPPKKPFQAFEEMTGFPMVRPQTDVLEAPFARIDTRWVNSELKAFTEDEIYHLVAPKRTFARRRELKQPLTPEETDKALRLARIGKLAQSVFGDADKAGRWMRKPKTSLGGAAPLAYLASENGARLIEDMLYRIDAGFSF
jgi:putative toxin-antitoxin system antitoxin component (TIGR02293 family)